MNDGLQFMHKAIRDARRRLAMTQSELASRADCRQSAISMFEAGRPHALAEEKVVLMASILGVDTVAFRENRLADRASGESVLKYCPSASCLSNVPYVIDDELHFQPTAVSAFGHERTRCSLCGEMMESRCPNRECGRNFVPGAFCASCGTPYIADPGSREWPPQTYVDQHQARIQALRQTMENARQLVRRQTDAQSMTHRVTDRQATEAEDARHEVAIPGGGMTGHETQNR